MASVQSNVDWQSTKNTILERNRHMFNNSDMSDIRFTCEGSDKTFYAHKYVLGTSSAVFRAMFYGALAVKDSIVHLSDTNEESLEQFLRFLYTEECTLTADNVVATMHLANKYIIPSLNEICVNFLLENLNAENVLDVLEQATCFGEKELEERCWKIIQSKTSEVVASDSFNNISQPTLTALLNQNKLNISEVELFQAVLKWIDFQCMCTNLELTSENRRSIIGKAIYAFRFLSMNQTEFNEHVSGSGLFTSDELVAIYKKFKKIDSPALKWALPSRTHGKIVRFSRFPGNAKELRKWYNLNPPDRLSFSVNKEVSLLGVRLFGDEEGSEYHVTFEVKESKVTGTYLSKRNQENIPGFDVMLLEPVSLKENELTTLSAIVKGPQSCHGENGLSSVALEGVSATFTDAPYPNNGNCVHSGQFHEIIILEI